MDNPIAPNAVEAPVALAIGSGCTMRITQIVPQVDGSILIWAAISDATPKIVHYAGYHAHLAHNCAIGKEGHSASAAPCATCSAGILAFVNGQPKGSPLSIAVGAG